MQLQTYATFGHDPLTSNRTESVSDTLSHTHHGSDLAGALLAT